MKQLLWRNSCSKKINCCVEGISPFGKKIKSQIKLVITFNWNYVFPRDSLTLISIHEESHMNSYEYLSGWPEPTKEEITIWCLCHTGQNQLRKKSLFHVCVILSSKIFKFVCITNKINCLNSCFLWLIFLLRGLFYS